MPPLLRSWRPAKAVTSATTSVVGTVMLTNFVRIFSSAVLTRLLSASDYGVVGIITSITYIVVMLSDFGFFAFVVRHEQGEDARFLDEVWTIRLIRSVAITGILIVLAYPYAAYAGKPVLAPAIAVWAFNQLLDGLSSMAFAQSVRQGLVARLSWMEFFVNLFQVLVTILLALWLHDYWSIVFAVLLGGALKVALSYTIFPSARRRWRFSRARRGELWKFSRFIAGSSFLTLLLGQSDKVVLSRLLSLELFGIYSIATLLALAPRAVVYPFCNRILYPAYSKHALEHGTDGFARVYYDRRRGVSAAYMFAMGGLIGAAPLVVGVLYDPRYAGVAPLLRIIAISASLLLNNTAAEQAMIALGRPQAPFQINALRFCWLAGAGTLGYWSFGPLGLIWAVGTVEVAAMVFVWLQLARLGLLRLGQEFLPIGSAVLGGMIALVASRAILWLGLF